MATPTRTVDLASAIEEAIDGGGAGGNGTRAVGGRDGPAGVRPDRTAVRDMLYALAVGKKAAQAEALWAELSRALPEPWRVEALGAAGILGLCARRRAVGRGVAGGGAALRSRRTGWQACSTRRCSRGCGPNRSGNSPRPATGSPNGSACGCRSRRTSAGGRADYVVTVAFWACLDLLDLDGVRHVVRQLDLLVAGDHDHHAAVRSLASTVTRALGTTPASLSRAISSTSPWTCSVSWRTTTATGKPDGQLGQPHQVAVLGSDPVARRRARTGRGWDCRTATWSGCRAPGRGAARRPRSSRAPSGTPRRALLPTAAR